MIFIWVENKDKQESKERNKDKKSSEHDESWLNTRKGKNGAVIRKQGIFLGY